jgi:ElaB/YqjD/DUF883 family membrane-anchored ribosome-binding protein
MPNDHARQQPAPLPPGARAPSHDQAKTFGAHIQEMGTQVKATAEDLGVQVKETAQDLGAHVKETAQDLGVQVKDTMTEYYAQGRESLRDVSQTLEGQIRAQPLQALLVAGGLGLLLALLTRRR